MTKEFVDIMILDNAAEDAEKFFEMIKGKYNTDVQASIIMLLVHLISENSNIPTDDLWGFFGCSCYGSRPFNKKHERRKKKKT